MGLANRSLSQHVVHLSDLEQVQHLEVLVASGNDGQLLVLCQFEICLYAHSLKSVCSHPVFDTPNGKGIALWGAKGMKELLRPGCLDIGFNKASYQLLNKLSTTPRDSLALHANADVPIQVILLHSGDPGPISHGLM